MKNIALSMFVFTILFVFSSSYKIPYLNIRAYYGRWIQIYTDYYVIAKQHNQTVCNSAYYYPNVLNTTLVINSDNKFNISGHLEQSHGWLERPHTDEPGKMLFYTLGRGDVPQVYWVYKLGPVDHYGQYTYSIVSDNNRESLYVYARNYTDFFENHNLDVISWLFRNGFDGMYNRPIPVTQNGCVYPEPIYE